MVIQGKFSIIGIEPNGWRDLKINQYGFSEWGGHFTKNSRVYFEKIPQKQYRQELNYLPQNFACPFKKVLNFKFRLIYSLSPNIKLLPTS